MAKVSDFMVTTFDTQRLSRLESPGGEGGAALVAGGEFLVITKGGRPLSLVAAGSLPVLSWQGKVSSLPVAPVVSEHAEFEDIVRELAPLLIGRSEIVGAVVMAGDRVRGVLPRSLIAEAARGLIGPLGGLPGNPLIPPPTFRCPRGDHEEDVHYYDPADPPRCPRHHVVLERKV